MRWLVSTLLTTMHGSRHRALEMFGRKPTLAHEEFQALAGVWRADLSLHPALHTGDAMLSLHLASPRGTTDFPSSGKVYAIEGNLPLNICEDADGWLCAWWTASRHVRAGANGDDTVSMTVQLGNMLLDGRGRLHSLHN